MRILLTNDDGIAAPGLEALQRIAEVLIEGNPNGEIWTVAPETNHSGAGHSLSLHEPIRLRQLNARTFAVKGTPTDCVIMGVRHVLADRVPDIILSGVNRGQNIAEDVTYSGTIAAAFEGTLVGIRSFALSQAFGRTNAEEPRWETAVAHAPGLIRELMAVAWAPDVLMNLNFPDRDPADVEGVQVTRQGRRNLGSLGVDERHDTWGKAYYWLGFEWRKSTPPEGTDLWAIHNGRISVTPLHLDLTHGAMHERLQSTGLAKG